MDTLAIVLSVTNLVFFLINMHLIHKRLSIQTDMAKSLAHWCRLNSDVLNYFHPELENMTLGDLRREQQSGSSGS